MSMDLDILKILACPACRGELDKLQPDKDLEGEKNMPEGLACNSCGLVYPVRDSIPVMLVEEAIKRADWDNGRRR